MKILRWLLALSVFVFIAVVVHRSHAQTAATQTSVPCATGNTPITGANQCKAGTTYGVTLSGTSVEFLGKDVFRNGLWIQNTGANTACIGFEMDGSPATLTTPQNCVNIPTGQPLYFSNFNTGTIAGKGIISGITGVSQGGTQVVFFFMEQ